MESWDAHVAGWIFGSIAVGLLTHGVNPFSISLIQFTWVPVDFSNGTVLAVRASFFIPDEATLSHLDFIFY